MIKNIFVSPDLCETFLSPKKGAMYYQEFQFFSNSIDLGSHITKRKQIFQRLKDSIFRKIPFKANYFHEFIEEIE